MRIVANFDPTTSTNDTFNAGFANGTGKMVVFNESNLNLQLSWGTFQTYCPAWTAMLYCVSTNNVNINWQIQSTLITSGAPISQVIVEVYDPGEPVLGTFPAPLVRQTNIGNASAVGGTAQSLANTGNAPGSTLITATPTDAATPTWNADISGNLTVKGDNAGTLTTLLQLIAGASPGVKLAAAAVLTEVLGTLTVDGASTFTGEITASSDLKTNTIRDNVNGNVGIDLSAGTGALTLPQLLTLTLGALLPNNVALNAKDSGGTSRVLAMMNTDNTARIASGAAGAIINMTDSTNGLTTVATKIVSCATGGNFKGITGTLSRFTFFTGTGSGTYSHSQGVTPQWVCAVTNIAGSATQGFDSGNSTTVHITLGAANAFTAFVVNS